MFEGFKDNKNKIKDTEHIRERGENTNNAKIAADEKLMQDIDELMNKMNEENGRLGDIEARRNLEKKAKSKPSFKKAVAKAAVIGGTLALGIALGGAAMYFGSKLTSKDQNRTVYDFPGLNNKDKWQPSNNDNQNDSDKSQIENLLDGELDKEYVTATVYVDYNGDGIADEGKEQTLRIDENDTDRHKERQTVGDLWGKVYDGAFSLPLIPSEYFDESGNLLSGALEKSVDALVDQSRNNIPTTWEMALALGDEPSVQDGSPISLSSEWTILAGDDVATGEYQADITKQLLETIDGGTVEVKRADEYYTLEIVTDKDTQEPGIQLTKINTAQIENETLRNQLAYHIDIKLPDGRELFDDSLSIRSVLDKIVPKEVAEKGYTVALCIECGQYVIIVGDIETVIIPSVEEETTSQTEGETEGQTEGETEGQTEGETEGQTEGETEGQTEGETEGQTEGETESQTEGETESQTKEETTKEETTEEETEPQTHETKNKQKEGEIAGPVVQPKGINDNTPVTSEKEDQKNFTAVKEQQEASKAASEEAKRASEAQAEAERLAEEQAKKVSQASIEEQQRIAAEQAASKAYDEAILDAAEKAVEEAYAAQKAEAEAREAAASKAAESAEAEVETEDNATNRANRIGGGDF